MARPASLPPSPTFPEPSQSPDLDPYVDYGSFLTAEGGVLFIHKDHDVRLRHTFWRVAAWSVATGAEAWFLYYHSPLHAPWRTLLCFVAVAIANWLIVRKPVEVYRRTEVRPDCMILESHQVFWLRHMENGWPAFRQDAAGNQVLCGIYGTRFVEYLIARRFDDYDRMPEVFGMRLKQAMEQLWSRPQ